MIQQKLSSVLPMVQIDRTSSSPLQRQIYDALREAILGGILAPGTRLPATRALAGELGISRITVNIAFAQLRAEGYLESHIGDGTYVTRSLPDDLISPQAMASNELGAPGALLPSARGRFMTKLWEGRIYQNPGLQPFDPLVPALDQFPCELWGRLESRRFGCGAATNLLYGDPAGYLPLREAIAAHLRANRALNCEASQVLITHGERQGLNLAAQALLDPGDSVWVEDPLSHDARTAFLLAGASLTPVRVDDQGLDVAEGEFLAPQARLAYICPSHQFPLGMTLSLTRRLALLDWAYRSDAWILEDDADCEYRYVGRPLSSLYGLDHRARVIYNGSFERTLFPGSRLGYMVVPHALMETFTAARALSDKSSSLVPQMALADFISEGHFQRHLRRMRAVHAKRRDILVENIRRSLDHLLAVQAPESGLHVLAELKHGLRDVDLARQAAQIGISLIPLSSYYLKNQARSGLLFGFAGFKESAIQVGIRRLSELWSGL